MNTSNNPSFLNLKFTSYKTIITIFILFFFTCNIIGYVLYRMQDSNYVVIVEIESNFTNSYFSFVERAIADYENKIFIQKNDKKLEKNFIKKILYNSKTKKSFIDEFNIELNPEIREDLSNFQIFDIKYKQSNSFLIKTTEEDLVLADKKINWFIDYLKAENFKIYVESVDNYLSFLNNAYNNNILKEEQNNVVEPTPPRVTNKELLDLANRKVMLDHLCSHQEYSDFCNFLIENNLNELKEDKDNELKEYNQLKNNNVNNELTTKKIAVTYKNFEDLLTSAGIKKNKFLNTDVIYEYKRDVYTSNFSFFTVLFIATLFSILISSFIIIFLFLVYKIRINE